MNTFFLNFIRSCKTVVRIIAESTFFVLRSVTRNWNRGSKFFPRFLLSGSNVSKLRTVTLSKNVHNRSGLICPVSSAMWHRTDVNFQNIWTVIMGLLLSLRNWNFVGWYQTYTSTRLQYIRFFDFRSCEPVMKSKSELWFVSFIIWLFKLGISLDNTT